MTALFDDDLQGRSLHLGSFVDITGDEERGQDGCFPAHFDIRPTPDTPSPMLLFSEIGRSSSPPCLEMRACEGYNSAQKREVNSSSECRLTQRMNSNRC